MYAAAGTSNDFAHGAACIPYCYLIELRSKKHKFKLPKEEIEDTGNEILHSVLALMEFVDSRPMLRQNKIDQKIDLLLQKNDSFTGNCSFVNTAKSHMKQCASYNKPNYSYLKQSDSLLKTQSFVRLTHFPGVRYDPVEESSDPEWPDYINNKDISVLRKDNTLDKETDVYTKFNGVITDSIDNIPLYYDSYTQKPDSLNDASLETDSSVKQTDSLTDREDSFEIWDNFYDQKNCFQEKRQRLLETSSTFITSNVQWYVLFYL